MVFPTSTLVNIFLFHEDGTVGGIVAESKNFPYIIWSTVFFTPVSRQKKILGTPWFDIDLSSLILQTAAKHEHIRQQISSISSSIFGCIRRPSDETMFSRFLLFCFRSFEQSSGVLGAVLESGRIITLALLRFAKYGVVKRLGLGDFDGWLIVGFVAQLQRKDKADDRLKF